MAAAHKDVPHFWSSLPNRRQLNGKQNGLIFTKVRTVLHYLFLHSTTVVTVTCQAPGPQQWMNWVRVLMALMSWWGDQIINRQRNKYVERRLVWNAVKNSNVGKEGGHGGVHVVRGAWGRPMDPAFEQRAEWSETGDPAAGRQRQRRTRSGCGRPRHAHGRPVWPHPSEQKRRRAREDTQVGTWRESGLPWVSSMIRFPWKPIAWAAEVRRESRAEVGRPVGSY